MPEHTPEYKIVPAPKKGLKAKGLKTPEDRFAHALSEVINTEARAGWEFLRAETLPSEERSGLRSSTIVYRSVLVFRKTAPQAEDFVDVPAPSVAPVTPPATPPVTPPATPRPVIAEDGEADEASAPEPGTQDSSSAKA